ncbi:dedicator of cytokinesis protein-like protein 1 [Dermatophagoides farinae]|uniref:Dedicator of cytokinesis protein-like protein 1 n=1 Tax=Dermatophagoides farinae TaxID=6954 RepID=A0A9D4SFB8_DERFA|nr:dedicator of cytokinesis protein-like protein 1 [Dermatophagoides farinae]
MMMMNTSNNNKPPTTNHHNRHHSMNSINLNQLTNLSIIDQPQQQQQCFPSSSSKSMTNQQTIFRNYHYYHLDNNISIMNGKSHTSSSSSMVVNQTMKNCNNNKSFIHDNFQRLRRRRYTSFVNGKNRYLPLLLGDIVIIVEYYGHQWYRGFRPYDDVTTSKQHHHQQQLGIFPASYVHVFDDYRQYRIQSGHHHNNINPMTFYYYTLLDPLYLQVIRTLREWYHILIRTYYRQNVNMEKFLIVRNLIYELFELISTTLGRDLAPTLWRRRRNQMLKINSDPKDPFARLYLDEDHDDNDNDDIDGGDNHNDHGHGCNDDITSDDGHQHTISSNNSIESIKNITTSTTMTMLDSNLEDLYERILSKLNQGNQHLAMDIMPSFTHGTTILQQQTSKLNQFQIDINFLTFHADDRQSLVSNERIKQRTKFFPYYPTRKDQCKYLPRILDYYNQINRCFNQKFRSNITTSINQQRHSFSSFVTPTATTTPKNTPTTTTNANSNNLIRKFRRHLLFTIRDANFAISNTATGNGSTSNGNGHHTIDSDQIQIEIYLVRYNNHNQMNHSDSTTASSTLTTSSTTMMMNSSSTNTANYEVLTEKFCYRLPSSSSSSRNSVNHMNRALFLDVLSKRTPQNLSSTHGHHHHSFHHQNSSQHSDASNYYLIIQVWRFSRTLTNDNGRNSVSKSVLSTSLSTTGQSVFHTISTASSIGSSAAAAASNSLSSLTSFVSNSFSSNSNNNNNNSGNGDCKTTTPDSSSIDSSSSQQQTAMTHSFKRSVGFAVIPLLELVSRDKEIRPSPELFQNESLLFRILFSDESMLLPLTVRLYEGDLTVSILESLLKHNRQNVHALSIGHSSSSSSSSSSLSLTSSSSISSQQNSSISKLSMLATNSYQLIVSAKFISELMINNTNNVQLKNNSNIQHYPTLSLADYLLLTHNQKSNLSGRSSVVTEVTTPYNFVLIQKRCFGDLITAGHFRNDFYLTLESAEFEKGGKTIAKNIEVSVCLITENGMQERAISSGINADPVTIYRSHIQYHQNSPKWFEHLKVNVPLEQFEMAHLRFTFCHCSSRERERKFLGFAFLPLADQNGACLSDGEHELYIYKCDNERKIDDSHFYLQQIPWGPNHLKDRKGSMNSQSLLSLNSTTTTTTTTSLSSLSTQSLLNSRSSKEMFHVKTALISSKLTQNSDILSLLKWSSLPLDQVFDSLQRLSRVPGEEMVKFLEDILDALFALFTMTTTTTNTATNIVNLNNSSGSSSSRILLIFRVLIDFFKTLNDPKFVSYRSALEKYIEKQFSAPLVYTGLIACVRRSVEMVIVSIQHTNNERSSSIDLSSTSSSTIVTKRDLEFILRCLSVLDWILKIIVQSRILYTRASITDNLIIENSVLQSDDQFKMELLSLFETIQRLLNSKCKSSDDYLIVAIQEAALNSMPNAFDFLSQILQPFEMAKLIQSLVQFNNHSMTTTSSSTNNRLSECFSPSGSLSSSSSSSVTPTNSSTPTAMKKKTSTIINAKLSLLQQSIKYPYIWMIDDEARLELLDTYIRMLNICIGESKYSLNILRDIVTFLIDNSEKFDPCLVRCAGVVGGQQRHTNEREIEMLSFGAVESIVEHIIELIGIVPTSFDHLLIDHHHNHHHHRFTRITGHNQMDISSTEMNDYLGSMIICLMVLFDYMSAKHFEKLFEKRTTIQCKELLLNLFAVFLNALYYFSDNWLEIKMAINRIMLHSLTMLRTTVMCKKFLGHEHFDETIWRMYFKLAIAFLTQPRLQLEQSSSSPSSSAPFVSSVSLWAKKRFILDVYGCDMRIVMGLELVSCWELIGPFKITFIPNLVGPFVDVTLIPESELRYATIPIFYDMLMVDYMANANFKQVEAALLDKLDVVAHRIECDQQFKELFTQILTDMIDVQKPVWSVDGLKLVRSVSRFLTLLIDYNNELKREFSSPTNVTMSSSSPSTKSSQKNCIDPDIGCNDRLLICTYTLLRFCLDDIDSMNRKTIMSRYLEKLANIHTLLGNYAEAGFTLKLQADQLTWSTESSRKESLCHTMLNYFEKGHCWEEGIRVCKELQQVYERNFKYRKLSAILKRNAELLDKILTEHRPDNEYFRVSFYGLKFPSFLQNSTFIFRGLEFEKISSFTHRIQREFPDAQLLTKVIPTDENITESKCQYIQIFSVKPIPELPISADLFGPVDHQVLKYYQTNSVRQFSQDRPIQRGPFDPNNEFKSLWIERTIYTTEQSLPGMLRMFKVTSTLVSYLSPIENACETIENKNSELSKLIHTYGGGGQESANRPESIAPLSMRLQGILDAAVNGGVAKYIEAFLGSEFLSANPDQATNVTRLKDRIAQQIQLVESGLQLHGRLAPTAVRPLHTRLLERFSTMRTTVHQANIETSQALLWCPNNASNHHRPSILSQPLPPIPQRTNHSDNVSIGEISSQSSSSDTSSLSSNSSLTTATAIIAHPSTLSQSNHSHHPNNNHHQHHSHQHHHDRLSLRTPPLSQPPSQPPYNHQSPGTKSLKNKPLPPLPPTSSSIISEQQQQQHPVVIKRHNSNVEHRPRLIVKQPPIEDSIYSVPQYTDLDLCNLLPDNESSVDDSMDYCDVNVNDHPNRHTATGAASIDMIDGVQPHQLSNRINRSFSIPSSAIAMSLYNNNNNGHKGNLIESIVDGDNNDDINVITTLSPPPLPPRSSGSTLDRSNSLNSGRYRPSSIGPPATPPPPPPPPPALPQRPMKKSSSISAATNNNTIVSNGGGRSSCSTPPIIPIVAKQPIVNQTIDPGPPIERPPPPPPTIPPSTTSNAHFTTLDGLEFENLLLSSPTPLSQQTTTSRPAPIIGIEINNNSNTTTAAISNNNGLSSLILDEIPGNHRPPSLELNRTKSNSLPRSLQQQFTDSMLNNNNQNTVVDNNNIIMDQTSSMMVHSNSNLPPPQSQSSPLTTLSTTGTTSSLLFH